MPALLPFRMLTLGIVMITLSIEGASPDPCNEISQRSTGISSFCEARTGLCEQLFWNSVSKQWFVVTQVGFPGLVAVDCSEAVQLAEIPPFLRINWDEVQGAVADICDMIGSQILPAALRIPVVNVSESPRLTMAMQDVWKQLWRMKGATRGLRVRLDRASLEMLKSCPSWEEWKRLMDEWMSIASVCRSQEAQFLKAIAPYVHLYKELVLDVFPVLSDEFKQVSSPFLREFFATFQRLYIPDWVEVDAVIVEDFFVQEEDSFQIFLSEILNRIRFETPSELFSTDKVLVDGMERMIFEKRIPEDAYVTVCDNLSSIANFICKVRPEPWLRITLILSLADLCKPTSASIEQRRKTMSAISDSFSGSYGQRADEVGSVSVLMRMPSFGPALIQAGLIFLQDLSLDLLRFPLAIHYTDTPAGGVAGPRNQWITQLVEHVFNVENNYMAFQYSDESERRFIKPVPSCSHNKLRAAGRLIGLSIRYGLTMGIKLTPLALMQLVSGQISPPSFDLENETRKEDAAFVNGLNNLRVLYRTAPTTLSRILPDLVITDEGQLEAYISEKLYEKSIASIRSEMLIISEGIRDVVPPGTLSLFTQEELTLIIRGVPNLPAHTLLEGIHFKGPRTPLFNWFIDIINESDDQFRFALNQFVTGVPQPPLGKSGDPWIFVSGEPSLSPTNLPTAQTCFGNLLLPLYQSKCILRNKLRLAVQEAIGSLELY